MRGRNSSIRSLLLLCTLALALALTSCNLLPGDSDRILVLVPDGVGLSDSRVTVWLDAGSEEGFHLVAMHDSEFVRPIFGRVRCAAVILPDSVHRQASDGLVDAIYRYVEEGGRLMLVYDAGTHSLDERYAGPTSRLSRLAGVNYAIYDALGDKTIRWGEVYGSAELMTQLAIPPGKYVSVQNPTATVVPTSLSGSKHDRVFSLTRYQFGDLQYPSFVTEGDYAGTTLMHSGDAVVAGYRAHGKGKVVFVNIPLGYLKGRTDGLLLHGFLRLFAGRLLSLPRMSAVPDGIGGLILNWHIDSNAAIEPLKEMSSWGITQQGPYSIHITAGPDMITFGDRRGIDVPHNPEIQAWIRTWVKEGHAVGSHGGWMHNYFGDNVNENNQSQFQTYLALNNTEIEKQTGAAVTEYSAPDGNHPKWVTRWLEEHGINAYYFTGNTGMGPTQGYRDGERAAVNAWAFPILHFGRAAGFEEMALLHYDAQEIERWLREVTDFVSQQRLARLVYFHPPGILPYKAVVENWAAHTAELSRNGSFRWYTMSTLATFLNARKRVEWQTREVDDTLKIRASHPETLTHQTWMLPKSAFERPNVSTGTAEVREAGDDWLVVAGDSSRIAFEARRKRGLQ
jgi:hypothetical protein